MNQSNARFFASAKLFLKDLFNLTEDKERESTTIADIKKGVEFRGANLWILLFAILIASIGLNVNSTAVVIGAMLISPLMGPIMGVGLGAGIYDFQLIKKAFRNLSIAVVLSIMTSSLYFAVTPLHEAQSELLARTTPTLWDVLIAFFGGLAGIIAGSRKEKSNAIPGVAIATALMPPLCTAGYGLANGNWYYFVGALYLFFINSVFISVSTFIIVRVLKYPKKKFETEAMARKVKSSVIAFVILASVPSIYLAYNVVNRTFFEQNARNFITSELNLEETQVINQRFTLDGKEKTIDVTLYGKVLNDEQVEEIKKRLIKYHLEDAKLIVRQGHQEDYAAATAQEFEKMSANLKISVLEDLYKKNEEVLDSKDKRISLLEEQVFKLQSQQYPIQDISKELAIQYPKLISLAIGDMVNQSQDTICYAVADFPYTVRRTDRKKINEWLRLRTKADSLIVVFQ